MAHEFVDYIYLYDNVFHYVTCFAIFAIFAAKNKRGI